MGLAETSFLFISHAGLLSFASRCCFQTGRSPLAGHWSSAPLEIASFRERVLACDAEELQRGRRRWPGRVALSPTSTRSSLVLLQLSSAVWSRSWPSAQLSSSTRTTLRPSRTSSLAWPNPRKRERELTPLVSDLVPIARPFCHSLSWFVCDRAGSRRPSSSTVGQRSRAASPSTTPRPPLSSTSPSSPRSARSTLAS